MLQLEVVHSKNNAEDVKSIVSGSHKIFEFKCFCGTSWKDKIWNAVRLAEIYGAVCPSCIKKINPSYKGRNYKKDWKPNV